MSLRPRSGGSFLLQKRNVPDHKQTCRGVFCYPSPLLRCAGRIGHPPKSEVSRISQSDRDAIRCGARTAMWRSVDATALVLKLDIGAVSHRRKDKNSA
jgi:hypothetical protein